MKKKLPLNDFKTKQKSKIHDTIPEELSLKKDLQHPHS
jgi:hypothetical protein